MVQRRSGVRTSVLTPASIDREGEGAGARLRDGSRIIQAVSIVRRRKETFMSLGVLPLLLLASVQAQPAASPAPPVVPPPSQTADTNLPSTAGPLVGPEVDLSGTWKGTTSQGREIEFHVEGNSLKLLRVAWQIGFEKACVAPDERLPMQTRQGVQLMRYQSPEPMTAGHLKTRLGIG